MNECTHSHMRTVCRRSRSVCGVSVCACLSVCLRARACASRCRFEYHIARERRRLAAAVGVHARTHNSIKLALISRAWRTANRCNHCFRTSSVPGPNACALACSRLSAAMKTFRSGGTRARARYATARERRRTYLLYSINNYKPVPLY